MSLHEFETSETIAHDPNVTLAAPVSVTTSMRTTVLPRVELVGEEPQVVADGKARYELTRRLGEGGVGEVVMARDNDIDRDVAIKRLRPELKSSHSTVLRFAEEVRTVGRLEHPNIVPIHDVGVDENGEYFFVMKYVHGETLETIIEQLAAGNRDYQARYPIERRVEIMMGVLEAIAYAHSKNIIHRDIKPANVMVGPYGEVMMMDWGLARVAGGKELAPAAPTSSPRLYETQVGAVLGTPAYMSPEQARGEALDARSDVYSLCMTFYELLALRHPFAEIKTLPEMLDAVKNTPAPRAYAIGVPTDLDWFLEKGLRKDPAERYQSVDEMIERLRKRAAGDIPIQCMVTFSMRMTTIVRQALAKRPVLVSSAFLAGSAATFGLAAFGALRLFVH